LWWVWLNEGWRFVCYLWGTYRPSCQECVNKSFWMVSLNMHWILPYFNNLVLRCIFQRWQVNFRYVWMSKSLPVVCENLCDRYCWWYQRCYWFLQQFNWVTLLVNCKNVARSILFHHLLILKADNFGELRAAIFCWTQLNILSLLFWRCNYLIR